MQYRHKSRHFVLKRLWKSVEVSTFLQGNERVARERLASINVDEILGICHVCIQRTVDFVPEIIGSAIFVGEKQPRDG